MLDIAIEAAKAGGQVAYSYFQRIPKVTYKPDKSPVTKADKEAELAIRRVISKHFPDHGIIGEEFPKINPNSRYQWVIDPIDGTRPYVRGLPDWSILVAVLKDDKPIIGVAYFKSQEEIFSTEVNKGAFLNGKKTSVSKVKRLNNSYISYYNLKHFNKIRKGKNLISITDKVYSSMNLGSFSLNHLLKGKVDAYLCAHGQVWDFAAFSILVNEAGGEFSDINGIDSLKNGTGIFTNGLLHKQVLNILK